MTRIPIAACIFFLPWIRHAEAAGQLSTHPVVANDFLVVPGKRVGPIQARTTEGDLQRIFGANQVIESSVLGPEGERVEATVVFPRTVDRLEILWSNRDHKRIDRIRIVAAGGHWRTAASGVSVGMSLPELVRRNHAIPLHFSGFGWDFGGYVSDWGIGPIGKAFDAKGGKGTIRLGCFSEDLRHLSAQQRFAVSGEKQISSSAPAVRVLRPFVSEISVNLQ